MQYLKCPSCGEQNMVDQQRCEVCSADLTVGAQETRPSVDAAERSQKFLADFLEVLYYAGQSTLPEIDAAAFLASIRLPQIDMSALIGPKGMANFDLPKPDLANIKLPQIELSDVSLPVVDIAAIGEFLAHIDFPDIDYAAVGDFLANVDMPDVDMAALGDLLSGVDIADVDLSGLLEMLGDFDLS